MSKTAVITARIEPKLKKAAETLLHALGLSHSDLVNMAYRQLVMQRGLPFETKVPNKKTQKAMREAAAGKNFTAYESADHMRRNFE